MSASTTTANRRRLSTLGSFRSGSGAQQGSSGSDFNTFTGTVAAGNNTKDGLRRRDSSKLSLGIVGILKNEEHRRRMSSVTSMSSFASASGLIAEGSKHRNRKRDKGKMNDVYDDEYMNLPNEPSLESIARKRSISRKLRPYFVN